MEISTTIRASGLGYEEVEEIIEKVANFKANQYGSIGYMDTEDLKQEIRFKCFKEISRFDERRHNSNMFGFFSTCADNRVKDIRRKLVYKNNKPCLSCPFYNKKADKRGEHDCSAFIDKFMCDKFVAYKQYIKKKLMVNRPINIESTNLFILDKSSSSQINKIDVAEFFKKHLPSGLNGTFKKLTRFNFNIDKLKPKERNELMTAIEEIYVDFKERFDND